MGDFIASDQKDKLKQEYGILHLIYHRNYNQHRVLIWWKYLNIIHRNVRKILKILVDLELIKNSHQIRHKEQQILDIIKYMMKKRVFTKAYYEFNGIIALGQFVTLGLALVGNLSKIYCILQSIKGVDQICKRQTIKETSVVPHEHWGTDDVGEIVDLDKISEDLQSKRKFDDGDDDDKGTKKLKTEISKKDDILSSTEFKSESKKKVSSENSIDFIFGNLKVDKKKKQKKKKKKRNEIDDIFNF